MTAPDVHDAQQPVPEPAPGTAVPAALQLEGAAGIRGRSPWELAWARLRRDRVAMISFVVIVLIILVALLAPVIAALIGHGPDDQFRAAGLTPAGLPEPPTGQFLFGTDDLGRDLLVRVVYGSRISLTVGVLSTLVAVAVGVAIGLTAGYFGGLVDSVLARLLDVVLSIPFVLAGVAVVSVTGPNLTVTILVIAFFSFAAVARIVRGQMISIREREYVEAARSLGASDMRIMFIDVLPNVLAPVIVYTTLLIPAAIVAEATLSFLGLGVPPPTATWGGMLDGATEYYRVAWWYLVFPGLALLITTLAFNLFGDGVRDAFDPRSDRLFALAPEED
ncbi:ABC transporter permease [Pseudonocardia sp. GCM10023141]|uniref:ABC transporter permease n=1 Tax=Pseudonocardia sp. GCM10023141 TaxID=3252653 RepID=UPI00360C800D